jgi:putative transcriptional regulator
MTQQEVADASGIQRSYYGLIETGHRNPTLKIATRIAKALDSSIEQVFSDEIFFGNKCYIAKL